MSPNIFLQTCHFTAVYHKSNIFWLVCVSIPLGVIIIFIASFWPNIEELWKNSWSGQRKQRRMHAYFGIPRKTANSRKPHQGSANQTTPQTANTIEDPSKGTETSPKPLKSYLRTLRSSLRSRRKSEIVDTEKGALERPDEPSSNRHKR